jgi:hypothetical protein
MTNENSRLVKTIEFIDEVNSEDPNKETFNGTEYPKELLYSMRMSEWLDKLEPGASNELRIATRAQHIQRWKIPRDRYPINRDGYREWRKVLMDLHADKVAEIMAQQGYGESSISRVKSLIKKEKFKTDYESQLLEDVVCLVFLDNYFSEFSKEHKNDKNKINRIITKTWNKMSEKGRALAIDLDIPDDARTLIVNALNSKP